MKLAASLNLESATNHSNANPIKYIELQYLYSVQYQREVSLEFKLYVALIYQIYPKKWHHIPGLGRPEMCTE